MHSKREGLLNDNERFNSLMAKVHALMNSRYLIVASLCCSLTSSVARQWMVLQNWCMIYAQVQTTCQTLNRKTRAKDTGPAANVFVPNTEGYSWLLKYAKTRTLQIVRQNKRFVRISLIFFTMFSTILLFYFQYGLSSMFWKVQKSLGS